MSGRPTIELRDARETDREAVVATLAAAFADDPAMSWIFPDPADRRRRLPRLFRLIFAEDAGGMRLAGGVHPAETSAVTLWRGPESVEIGRLAWLRSAIPLLHALGFSTRRAMAAAEATAAHHPARPFWYLHFAAVDPAHQGLGLGSGSIRAGLSRIAGSGLPTYLETATERNLSIYQALGFEVTGEWDVPGGGPHFWSMLRAAD